MELIYKNMVPKPGDDLYSMCVCVCLYITNLHLPMANFNIYRTGVLTFRYQDFQQTSS
jgi:hypothetical protein